MQHNPAVETSEAARLLFSRLTTPGVFPVCHWLVNFFSRQACRRRGSVVEKPQFAANHPQSLWITLWASFRRKRQVTYRKGFFFFRSIFERWNLHHAIRYLRNLSLWDRFVTIVAAAGASPLGYTVDRRFARVGPQNRLSQSPTRTFRLSYAQASSRPTKQVPNGR